MFPYDFGVPLTFFLAPPCYSGICVMMLVSLLVVLPGPRQSHNKKDFLCQKLHLDGLGHVLQILTGNPRQHLDILTHVLFIKANIQYAVRFG